MRIITENDRKALVAAFRVFIRALNGERFNRAEGADLIDKAVSSGISVDVLLNKENWGRAVAVAGDIGAKEYVDILCGNRIDARELTEEPLWHEVSNGFGVIAEAAHDFFMEITGKGGKWNIPSALTNLAKAVRAHGLQAILSEALIKAVTEKTGDPEMTYFYYINEIVRDFDTLPVDSSPTQMQLDRQTEQDEYIESITREIDDASTGTDGDRDEPAPEDGPAEEDEDEGIPGEPDEDEPFPEPEENGFETMFIVQNNPRDFKKEALRNALGNYTPTELMGIVATVEDGESKSISELIDDFADGRFDPSLETNDARSIHMSICGDLLPTFVNCVRTQGIDMDEETAGQYDILHDSWDLRSPETRKLHKLTKLIYSAAHDDPDLLSAIPDIERLYGDL